jgi:hypothetical protein
MVSQGRCGRSVRYDAKPGKLRDPAPSAPSPTSSPTVSPAPVFRIGDLLCETADEYVRVDNIGTGAGNLSGWFIYSVIGSETYVFSGYVLSPGRSVYVHSGPRAPPTGGHDLRWTTEFIWNDGYDTARLKDAQGQLVDEDDC